MLCFDACAHCFSIFFRVIHIFPNCSGYLFNQNMNEKNSYCIKSKNWDTAYSNSDKHLKLNIEVPTAGEVLNCELGTLIRLSTRISLLWVFKFRKLTGNSHVKLKFAVDNQLPSGHLVPK